MRRYDALNDYLAKLESFQAFSRDEFLSTPSVHDLAERYLHLAMECVFDIANHYVADEGLGTPATNREVFDRLEEAGAVSASLAERLRSWAGFRNVIVHLYLDIDHAVSYQAIQENLADLHEFSRWALSVLTAES